MSRSIDGWRRRLLLAGGAGLGLTLGAAASSRASTVPLLSMRQAATMLAGGGHVLMVRHAATVAGVGDPPGFRLDDCGSQRNLSGQGRAQARDIGVALRAHGVPVDDIRSSEWCRCRDTAQLAFGEHQVWTPLNSFFGGAADPERHTVPVWSLAAAYRGISNPVLVTHQVNITAATGVYPQPGQMVALTGRSGAVVVAFTFVPTLP